MYTDDDLEDKNPWDVLLSKDNGPPYLHAYDYEEGEALRNRHRTLRSWRTSSANDSENMGRKSVVTFYDDMIRVWRVRRFFKTMRGFYSGKLDLSGRHKSRLLVIQEIWRRYEVGFQELRGNLASSTFEQNDRTMEEELQVTDCAIEIWESFCKHWMIPSTWISYSELLAETEKTVNVLLASSNVPKFQKICLADLPTEILDAIFSNARESQTRILFSTCRRLYEIGRRYLFRHRRIVIKRGMSFYKKLPEPDSLARDQYIANSAVAALEDALAFCNHLESHQDVLYGLESLWIADQWADMHDPILQDHLVPDNGSFHHRFFDSLERVFTLSANLTSISFGPISLPLQLIACLGRLPNLDHLELRSSTISEEAQQVMLLAGNSLSSSVRSLDIMVNDTEDSPWYAILICPNLSYFSARAIADDCMLPPPDVLWDRFPFFSTLEYLFLGNIAPFHALEFAEWIHFASHGSIPCLTHLKFSSMLSMPDMDVISVLQAFRNAPLRALSIGGASQANLDFFDWVSQTFPDLQAFTVSRRDSTRQTRDTRSAPWPLPIWQYAERFSGFSHLKHFGWNNHSFLGSFSTYALRFLEDGWPDENDYHSWREADINEYFDSEEDAHAAPVLFGIHCPSLRTMHVEYSPYRILRPSGGVVKAEREGSSGFDKWNPDSSFGHWPRTTEPTG